MVSDLLDVLIRFHDPSRLAELSRCLFSVVTQTYAPIKITLLTQRFLKEEIEQTQQSLAPVLQIEPGIRFEILNYEHETPVDARSELLNLGVARTSGRFLAFLDYDDTLYPEAYELLTRAIHSSGSVIAFAKVCVKDVSLFGDATIVHTKWFPFEGADLHDLLRKNFCPLHSYLVDRSRIETNDLKFNPSLTRLEDYDFLIRLCAKYRSDFSIVSTVVGDYYMKTDGSNSTFNMAESPDWKNCQRAIERIKEEIELSEEVLATVKWKYSARPVTVAKLLGIGRIESKESGAKRVCC